MTANSLNRRHLLAGAAALGASYLTRSVAAAEKPYGPFRLGIQSYSLRGYGLDDALKHSQELGIHYWESYMAHIPLTTDAAEIATLKAKLKASGVKLMGHGVHAFGKDEAANRRIFEAAKAMGITTLSADPAPESFDQLDKLVEEFKINVAIHNHGPESRWNKISSVVDAVKGRHKRIGACVDTGHFLRSSENPVDAIKQLGERVYGCHLKDVKGANHFTILGQGDLDVVGVLRELKKLKFKEVLALEYEENPQNPISDIRQCLEAVKTAVAKI